jgi:hypothetical protein
MPAATFPMHSKRSQVDTPIETAAPRGRQQYEDLVESLEAIVWRANAHTLEHVYVSEQAETVLGYPLMISPITGSTIASGQPTAGTSTFMNASIPSSRKADAGNWSAS